MKPLKSRVLYTRFLQHYSTETLFRLVLLLLTLNGNTGMVLNDIGTILRDLVPIDNVPPITMNRVVSKLHHQIHYIHSIKFFNYQRLTSWTRIPVDDSGTLDSRHVPTHPIQEWGT